ncbi:MAG: hypothetical protein LAP21_09400 [Acidobacteriia bacterium]|nr:hypothetical protein [Terriglobia bacterium]
MNLAEVKSRIRALVDDPDGTYVTDGFLGPLINQKYEEIYNRMLSTGAEFERRVVELSNVAALTSDLSVYNLPGRELELMLQPVLLEWKQAGFDPTSYRTASLVDRVRDVIQAQTLDDWEFRSGVIYITPTVLDVDIRIRGDFLFAPLTAETDAIAAAKNLGHAVAYGTASLIGTVRGNPAWTQAYAILQDNAVDDVMQYLARKDQAKVRRVGRITRRRDRVIW